MKRLAACVLLLSVAVALVLPAAAIAEGTPQGTLVVVITVLTPPEGVGPEDFVARIAGPDGVIEVAGNGQGKVVVPVTPGEYRLLGQQGPADLQFVQTSNGPVVVPAGGSATLTITNAVPAMSSISTQPTVTVQAATSVPAASTPIPTYVDAGGGGAALAAADRAGRAPALVATTSGAPASGALASGALIVVALIAVAAAALRLGRRNLQ